jgi:lysozyme family protein
MLTNYDQSLKYVLLDEGGNDDDPQDPGGRTSRGITQREYNAWCSLHGKVPGDVWHATDEDVHAIYKSQYWDPYCDALPSGLDYLFFDISVNCGRARAVKQFQQALGVKADGMMGQVTLSAISGYSDTQSLIKRISELRRAFYRGLKGYPRFGKGWLARVQHSEDRAIAMVENVHINNPTPAPVEKPTAYNYAAISPSASTAVTGGAIAVLTQFKDQIQGLTSFIPDLNYVLLGTAVVGLGYAAWGMYKNSKVVT